MSAGLRRRALLGAGIGACPLPGAQQPLPGVAQLQLPGVLLPVTTADSLKHKTF